MKQKMDFEIGKIVNTHGLKGEMKVFPLTDDPKRFELLKTVDLHLNQTVHTYTIKSVRYQKNMIILKLAEINHINEAEKLKNGIFKISEDQALPLSEDEYFMRDLYGLEVYEGEEWLGTLAQIIETGANDVYIIKKEQEKDLLIPAIKSCILKVDIKNKRMEVKLLQGLR